MTILRQAEIESVKTEVKAKSEMKIGASKFPDHLFAARPKS
jgi:hypothetical protein